MNNTIVVVPAKKNVHIVSPYSCIFSVSSAAKTEPRFRVYIRRHRKQSDADSLSNLSSGETSTLCRLSFQASENFITYIICAMRLQSAYHRNSPDSF